MKQLISMYITVIFIHSKAMEIGPQQEMAVLILNLHEGNLIKYISSMGQGGNGCLV